MLFCRDAVRDDVDRSSAPISSRRGSSSASGSTSVSGSGSAGAAAVDSSSCFASGFSLSSSLLCAGISLVPSSGDAGVVSASSLSFSAGAGLDVVVADSTDVTVGTEAGSGVGCLGDITVVEVVVAEGRGEL